MRTIGIILLGLSLAFLPACKEVGPDINLHGSQHSVSDTTYVESPVATAETKNVLVEDFTGVRCPNCPQGHQIIDALKASNSHVISMSLHPINSLGAPYPFSIENFERQKAQDLFAYLIPIGFEPVGAIDRKLYQGESNVLLDKSKWTANANQQTTLTTPVNLLLSKEYDSTNRSLKIIVELHYTQAVAEANKITIAITETNIITSQLNGSAIDTFYTHKDVFRDFVTATQGDALTDSLQSGRVIRKVYQTMVDAAWKPENLSIIAYVHEYQNAKTVYQVKSIKLN